LIWFSYRRHMLYLFCLVCMDFMFQSTMKVLLFIYWLRHEVIFWWTGTENLVVPCWTYGGVQIRDHAWEVCSSFFFLFVCSIGFELSICIFSLKSWYVGKGNEWQQRIFLVHIVWSQFRWLNWFIITKYLIFIWHFTNWKLVQFLIPSITNILR